MPFKLLLFITRKPTVSPAEFKDHWDNKHVALLKSIAGDKFPLTHTRNCISRTEDNGTWPANVIVGTQEDFSYDGIAELVFENEAAFKTFFAIISESEAAARIAADEEVFAVREKFKAIVLGETSVTSRD
ncbi:hypothetical protein GRF29_161g156383 [Pseudopithomyces chartarum]|uniref:EthD domain-containing protein n=1 Tax=Pseudopithomyces chartarum TaxID=1892770 RepID=A0AAN6RE03_9PLEO|nr:hypothetical protein GRF29_161g156383 [Pseudopithomyces chartarum]